jgi:hypothetical protein
MSKVNIIERVADAVQIRCQETIVLSSLEGILQQATKGLKMERLLIYRPGEHTYHIRQNGRFWWIRRLWSFAYDSSPIVKIQVKRRKVITTVYNRAILEIVKEELLKAAEKLEINELVIIKNFG